MLGSLAWAGSFFSWRQALLGFTGASGRRGPWKTQGEAADAGRPRFEPKLEHFIGQGKHRIKHLAVHLFVRVTDQPFQFGRFKNLSRRKMFLRIVNRQKQFNHFAQSIRAAQACDY